jgi:hypothetical protein
MPQPILFVQIQGNARIVEVPIADNVTEAEVHNALSAAGVLATPELFIFMDEADEHIRRESDRPAPGAKHGARVHVARCHRVKTTMHFLDKTIDREFPPGARVRSVKAWAVREFYLDHKDAAEHVLQICNSTERPASDTPLHALLHGHDCAVCFDLVPEKRVEG